MSDLVRWYLIPDFWVSPGLESVASTTGESGYAPMPTAQNTGPVAGISLTSHSGDLVLNTDGQTESNLDISGNVYLAANNVTLTNCKVGQSIYFNSGPSGNYYFPVKANQKIAHCSAKGAWCTGIGPAEMDSCFFGNSTTSFMQLNSYFNSNNGNTYAATQVTIKNCLFDGLIPSGGTKHMEAIHLMNVTDSQFINNVFRFIAADQATATQVSACVFIENNPHPCDNLLFDHNWFYAGKPDGATGYYYEMATNATNSTYTNNYFNSFSPGSGGILYPFASPNPFTQSGNTLDGAPYVMDNAQQ